MHQLRLLVPCLSALGLAAGCGHAGHATGADPSHGTSAAAAPMLAEPIDAPAGLTVTSGGFTAGQALPSTFAYNGMGCSGQNVSPELVWQGAPSHTRSYAVIMHDPDAPTGVGFFHWSAFDLPASVTRLAEGASTALPEGARAGTNDAGTGGYVGPCPPPGPTHRYVVTVYALDVAHLEGAGEHASGALLRFLMRGHVLAYGRLSGTYQRL